MLNIRKLFRACQICRKKFNEATDGQFEAQIKVSTDSEKIIEGIQKAYKEAKRDNKSIEAGID